MINMQKEFRKPCPFCDGRGHIEPKQPDKECPYCQGGCDVGSCLDVIFVHQQGYPLQFNHWFTEMAIRALYMKAEEVTVRKDNRRTLVVPVAVTFGALTNDNCLDCGVNPDEYNGDEHVENFDRSEMVLGLKGFLTDAMDDMEVPHMDETEYYDVKITGFKVLKK